MEEKYYFEGVKVAYSSMQDIPENPLKRPEIHYKKFVVALVGFIISVIIVGGISSYLLQESGKPVLYTVFICLGASTVYMRIIAKRAIIWLVHFYQNKAPDEVRLQCVFEPSCSEYMILAVEKYGVIRGVFKGINRLRRCHGPNCGIDYP